MTFPRIQRTKTLPAFSKRPNSFPFKRKIAVSARALDMRRQPSQLQIKGLTVCRYAMQNLPDLFFFSLSRSLYNTNSSQPIFETNTGAQQNNIQHRWLWTAALIRKQPSRHWLIRKTAASGVSHGRVHDTGHTKGGVEQTDCRQPDTLGIHAVEKVAHYTHARVRHSSEGEGELDDAPQHGAERV